MRNQWIDKYQLVWDEGKEPPKEQKKTVEHIVHRELMKDMFLEGLEKPCELLFHTVFLGPDIHTGPFVLLTGGDEYEFFASYEKDLD